MMKLRINPLVAQDLKSIKDYIAEDNADKALETIQEIYRQFENIQQFPYIGADLSKRVSFKTDYKYVVWKDYVVLYKVGKEVVEIYRVFLCLFQFMGFAYPFQAPLNCKFYYGNFYLSLIKYA